MARDPPRRPTRPVPRASDLTRHVRSPGSWVVRTAIARVAIVQEQVACPARQSLAAAGRQRVKPRRPARRRPPLSPEVHPKRSRLTEPGQIDQAPSAPGGGVRRRSSSTRIPLAGAADAGRSVPTAAALSRPSNAMAHLPVPGHGVNLLRVAGLETSSSACRTALPSARDDARRTNLPGAADIRAGRPVAAGRSLRPCRPDTAVHRSGRAKPYRRRG